MECVADWQLQEEEWWGVEQEWGEVWEEWDDEWEKGNLAWHEDLIVTPAIADLTEATDVLSSLE